MRNRLTATAAFVAMCGALVPCTTLALAVTSFSPARHLNNAPTSSAISVTFDTAVNPATITVGTFRVFGKVSGPVRGLFTFSNSNRTVTLTPDRAFTVGETVTVNLSHDIAGANATTLRGAGYAWQFNTRTAVANLEFQLIDTISVSINGETTRLYGGFAGDFDHDGWMDLTGVNEVSHDLRVLMNRDDGSGLFHPVLQPVTPIGAEASPNESGDLDNDGEIDGAIVNSSSSTVSIVLGNGDGSFAPQVTYATGTGSHGIALLDANGDAAWDYVTTAYSSGNLRLRLNNGSGAFGSPTTFDGGGNGEWPIAAGDFNNDGIMDLVAGLADSQQVAILLGVGNGTFGTPAPFAAGGFTWQIAVGDLNNDGNLDVAVANGGSSNGGILLGAGNGTLGAVTNHPTGGSMVASDLGDLDGDGDLDWIMSSYGASRAYLYRNNGNGTMTFDQEFLVPEAGSCAVMFDTDNDTDLDVTIFDELADTISVFRNVGDPSSTLFANGFE
jgi:hypothetical protein